jgi:RNA polymerase sigma factor (sigma-70 family)
LRIKASKFLKNFGAGECSVVDNAPDRDLVSAYRAGDQQAAVTLFQRYHARLIGLVRRQTGWRLKELEESTDMAQSVLGSLFAQLQQSRIEVGPNDSLWPLIVTITLNKVRNRGKFWQRERRDPSRQVPLSEAADPLEQEPSPEDAALAKDLIERLLAPFSDRRRQIVELILAGEPVGQIAAQMGTTERTIYNTRRAAAKILEEALGAG